MSERIPRKLGQPAKSDKHSDLYTDEDPKGTIHGLKFATTEDAKASVSKIKSSSRSHAHKIQAAIAMEQRAKVMGKAGAAAVYRSFINSMKEKTKEMREESKPVNDAKKWTKTQPKKSKEEIDRVHKKHADFEKSMNEDAPVNVVGGGAIAGLGVGPQGEPGVNMKKKRKVIPFAMFVRKKPN